jgi:hypothetical protein
MVRRFGVCVAVVAVLAALTSFVPGVSAAEIRTPTTKQ